MDISAKITGIRYSPYMCSDLDHFSIECLEDTLYKHRKGAFILSIDKNKEIALSWWTSPKRTRSYPYARVYDTLGFSGKKATIIPIIKDEGKEGDRDFLQWDTISLMSLLGIYTIISYYCDAEKSSGYEQKITNQKFDIKHIKKEINCLLSCQSDALHWNLAQIEKVGSIAQKALESYDKISDKHGVEMHSKKSARKRVDELLRGKESFMNFSRSLAQKAQNRESITVQPKEKLIGTKATITIENYLKGCYFLTCDESNIDKETIYLIEGKHSKRSVIPSLEDIKDGLVKMILFTNLKEVKVENTKYTPIPVLKLTSDKKFSKSFLSESQIDILQCLKKEAKRNKFQVLINNIDLQKINI